MFGYNELEPSNVIKEKPIQIQKIHTAVSKSLSSLIPRATRINSNIWKGNTHMIIKFSELQ